jgi:hypothetical protein
MELNSAAKAVAIAVWGLAMLGLGRALLAVDSTDRFLVSVMAGGSILAATVVLPIFPVVRRSGAARKWIGWAFLAGMSLFAIGVSGAYWKDRLIH